MTSAQQEGGKRAVRFAHEHPLVVLVVLALLVRAVYFAIFAAGSEDPTQLGGGDGSGYWQLGTHLSHELSFDQPTFVLRPPGWPSLLAIGLVLTPGDSAWLAVALNVLLSLAVVPLVYLLARTLGLSRRIGLAAAFVIAIEPVGARMAVTSYSEPLFTVLFTTAVILAVTAVRRPERAPVYSVLSGLAAGAALLTKPAALGLGVVLALILVIALRPRLNLRIAAAAAALAAISLGPYFFWAESNDRNLGVSTFSSASSWNLYFKRGTGVLRRVTGESPGEIEQRLADRLSVSIGESPGAATAGEYLTTTDPDAIHQMRELALEIFEEHPGWFAAMFGVGAAKLYFQAIDGSTLVFAAAQAVIYLLALIGLRRLWSDNRFALWVIVSIVAFYTLGTITFESSGQTRLLMPVMPLIAIGAAAGIASLLDRRGMRQTARTP